MDQAGIDSQVTSADEINNKEIASDVKESIDARSLDSSLLSFEKSIELPVNELETDQNVKERQADEVEEQYNVQKDDEKNDQVKVDINKSKVPYQRAISTNPFLPFPVEANFGNKVDNQNDNMKDTNNLSNSLNIQPNHTRDDTSNLSNSLNDNRDNTSNLSNSLNNIRDNTSNLSNSLNNNRDNTSNLSNSLNNNRYNTTNLSNSLNNNRDNNSNPSNSLNNNRDNTGNLSNSLNQQYEMHPHPVETTDEFSSMNNSTSLNKSNLFPSNNSLTSKDFDTYSILSEGDEKSVSDFQNITMKSGMSQSTKSLSLSTNVDQNEHYNLGKASSVPHLPAAVKTVTQYKSSKQHTVHRKKKASIEAYADPMLFKQLLQENQLLKERIANEEINKKEIVAINHSWDEQYNILKDKFITLQQEYINIKSSLTNDQSGLQKHIADKDAEITRLKRKIEQMFNDKFDNDDASSLGDLDEQVNEASINKEVQKNNKEPYPDKMLDDNARMESLLVEGRTEREMLHKREQSALVAAKEMEMRCMYLQNALQHESQQRSILQSELQRLTLLIEKNYSMGSNNIPSSPNGSFVNGMNSNSNPLENHNNNADIRNQMELLKQQLNLYKEDFNMEKCEKEKLLNENEQIRIKLNEMREEREHLLKQLQIYEEDFYRERQKRIQLMRKSSNCTPTGMLSTSPGPSLNQASMLSASPSHNGSATPTHGLPEQEDPQTKYKEYCSLIVEREQLADRINELENQGISRYNGIQRQQSASSAASLNYQTQRSRQLPQPPLQNEAMMNPYFFPDHRSRDNWSPTQYSTSSRATSEASSRMRGLQNNNSHFTLNNNNQQNRKPGQQSNLQYHEQQSNSHRNGQQSNSDPIFNREYIFDITASIT